MGERRLDVLFAFRIQRARRFIQKENRRVLQDRAGNRNPLTLSAGELGSGFADLRLKAIRKRLNERGEAGRVRRAPDLFLSRSRAPYAIFAAIVSLKITTS